MEGDVNTYLEVCRLGCVPREAVAFSVLAMCNGNKSTMQNRQLRSYAPQSLRIHPEDQKSVLIGQFQKINLM